MCGLIVRRAWCRIPVLSLAATGLLAAALGACTPSERATVVARVNEQAISADELVRELRLRRGPAVLVEMIDSELIRAGAAQAGITVTDEEMALRWERAVAQAGSEADFEAVLASRKLTREQFRALLQQDLLLDKLAKATMSIPEQEVLDFYAEHREDYAVGERVKGRMMLLGSESDAQTVLEALKAGGDFAGLAQALSLDPATREKGGEMGWFEREDYAQPISDAAFALQPGQISGPIQVPDGWVIVQVQERKPAGYRELEEVREEVRGRIERAKLPYAREEWIRRAREQATVQILDEALRETTESLLQHAPPPEPVTLLPVPPPQ
ncbi:MAG: peptidyl-prolyl cis-trans isomerase [Armatimonadota bacterium]